MTDNKIDAATEDVLRLLVYVLVADKKIHQEEIEGFVQASLSLELVGTDITLLSRAWLFDWFLHNCEAIRAESESPDIDGKIAHLFVRLQSWPNKPGLLEALRSVAASDGQYHLTEKVLIALAAAYWDAKTPAMDS